ncbi:MAG: DUF3305 domain-containing protein [Gammaproteobacteria bacterium]|nr:DUF3305 domain-containing protein [Gammaproteobacteria bacterium]
MTEQVDDIALVEKFPVSIIMQHRTIENNIWVSEKWEVEAVVAGGGTADAEPERGILRIGAGDKKYIWSNYQISLFKDEAESYYFNIISDTPFVFVVCEDEEGNGELKPSTVSVNYDEAGSNLEVDNEVFQVPMPAEIYKWLEAFVLKHYAPEKRKKRKRVDWKEDTNKANH